MAEIASAVFAGVTVLWDKTVTCYSYAEIYRRNSDSLAGKSKTLRAHREDMRRRIEEAEKQGKVITSIAKDWIERADEMLDEVSNLKKETTIFRRFKRLKEIEKCTVKLDAIRNELPIEEFYTPPPLPAPCPIIVHFEKAAAEEDLRRVTKALERVSIVGVFGTGGVGKTTLVNQVKRQAEAEGIYNHVVFATISKPPNIEKIQNQIAESFGLDLKSGHSREMRAAQIKDKIKRARRVLIILDDLWEELVPSEIGVPSGEELADWESKIVITTRIEHVCNSYKMKCQEMIKVETWPVSESREFFKKTAGTMFDSREFHEIANLVADECGGLPLALVAVANALGDKDDIDEWKKALQRLRQSKPPHPDDDGRVYRSIKLSYDYLITKEAQMCFLIGCLFPEDHNIEIEEMARYVFGLGLFREANTVEEARGDTGTIVKKLKASGLLLEGDKMGQVKMHDAIRDVAIQITSETPWIDDPASGENRAEEKQVFMVHTGNHPVKEWPIRETYESYTAISLMSHDISTLPDGLICQKLQTLLLQDNNNLEEIPETFFENMTALRVLDLSGIQSPLLPSSIRKLTMLRSLHLDRTALTEISELGALERLAILSFKFSAIEEFPKDMGKLINLRMLDLTNSHQIKIPAKVLSGFPNLEELYLGGSFAQWRIEADEETTNYASFAEVINLPRLVVLNIDIVEAKSLPIDVKRIPTWSKFDICMSWDSVIRLKNVGVAGKKSAYSRNFTIYDTSMKDFPDWFSTATKKMEKLKYTTCNKLNLLEVQDLECLPSLKSLVIEYSKCSQNILLHQEEEGVSICKPVFDSLEELRIHDTSITDICIVELPTGSLNNLKFLEIQQCVSLLHSLLPSNLVKMLDNLEKLHVRKNTVEEVFEFDNLDERLYLGRLTEIRLFELYELKQLSKGKPRFAYFSNLTSVSVIKCNKLSHLFSVSLEEGFSRLEELWVEECTAMKEIIRGEEEIILQRIKLPALKALCLMKLPKLSSFYAGNAVLECPSLEHLHVLDCPGLRAPASSFRSSNQVRENNERHMTMLSKRMKNLAY